MQGIFYASTSTYGLPPDEKYHYESTQLYAQQTVEAGPFLDKQPPQTLSKVDNIERNSSYLYHYILSWPVRIMDKLSISPTSQILSLRFFNVLLGVLTVLALMRILDELISQNKILKNLSVAALSLTGAFVFLAGAVNYDNLANLLFLLFLLFSVRFIKNSRVINLVWATTTGLATVLTKYTFLPVIGLGLLILFVVFVRNSGLNLQKYTKHIASYYQAKKAVTIFSTIALLLFSFLFVERVVINLVEYRQVQPSCTKMFTPAQCYENFGVYKRNTDLKERFNKSGGLEAHADFNMFTQTGEWTNRMYAGLYHYFGLHKVGQYTLGEIVAFAIATSFAGTLFLSRKKMNIKKEHIFVGSLVLLYVLVLFTFNLKTFLTLGERVAYQGRYLLPVIGFLYFFAGLIIYATYINFGKFKKVFINSWIVLLVVAAAIHLPPLMIYKYAVDAKGTPYSIRPFGVKYRER